jgi:acetyl-CoA carboxylase carboxyltransferase component
MIEDDQERAEFVSAKRAEYDTDIDVVRLASELVVDDIVAPEALRDELVRRLRLARTKDRHFSRRRHGVTPV